MESLFDGTKVNLDHVHDKGMITRGQNVKFSLHVVLEPRLQWNSFHRKSNLVVVLLLDQLDYAVAARPKRISNVEQFVDLFGF